MDKTLLSRSIKERAKQLGFSASGIARADLLEEEAPHLEAWLKLGMNGEMAYMAESVEKRLDPRLLFGGASSVICLLSSYYTDKQPDDPLAPKLARYARCQDYHRVLREKLSALSEYIETLTGPFRSKSFVDVGPVLEKAWAAKAGLGWIGKNSLLLSSELGSFCFAAELVVDLELDYDEPVPDHCGNCTLCLEACPTKAITAPRVIDARKCISYLTNELKGEPPREMAGKLDGWVFGCDLCQDVCPWNRHLKPQVDPLFEPNPVLLKMTRDQWLEMTEDTFESVLGGSAVKRRGYEKLRKNIEFLKLV